MAIANPADLEELLSRPTAELVAALAGIAGDIVVLGVGGKMGPTLAILAKRASKMAGRDRRVIGVARFSDPTLPDLLHRSGIETHSADLLDPAQVTALPDAPNVVFMVGQKFGTSGDEARTWAVNAFLPGLVAERYRQSRIVAFSTGNVYPLWPSESEGPNEHDATGPVGEYAQSALARERVLEFASRRHGTPMAILRLNYAVEPRYGVLRDIADCVWQRRPVQLAMGKVNLIWQRDANAVALAALTACASPPLVLNVTGTPAVQVRWIAERLAERWQLPVQFEGMESETALLSNASAMEEQFGALPVGIHEMIDLVAAWVEQGGPSLGKPTHFEEREGRY